MCQKWYPISEISLIHPNSDVSPIVVSNFEYILTNCKIDTQLVCVQGSNLHSLLAEQCKVLDNINPMGHRVENNPEDNLSRAQSINALVEGRASLSIDRNFAV